MLTASQPKSAFRAYCRTASILTAIDRARAYKAVIGFCPLDGLFYVTDPEDYAKGPYIVCQLPVPWLAKADR